MKIFPLLLFFLAMTGNAFTQIKKGQFLIGGSIRFESVKENYYPDNMYQSTNFFVSPEAGYFFLNKMAGGVRVDFSSYKSNSSSVETHSRSTAISPFVRYYFLPVAAKVNSFLDAGYVYSKTKWIGISSPAISDNSKGFQILARPSLFLTEQIALEFILGIRQIKANDMPAVLEAAKSTTISGGFGLQIHLGKKQKRSG